MDYSCSSLPTNPSYTGVQGTIWTIPAPAYILIQVILEYRGLYGLFLLVEFNIRSLAGFLWCAMFHIVKYSLLLLFYSKGRVKILVLTFTLVVRSVVLASSTSIGWNSLDRTASQNSAKCLAFQKCFVTVCCSFHPSWLLDNFQIFVSTFF